jgi:thymidylate kinase
VTISWPQKRSDIVIVEEYVPGTVADYVFWWTICGKKNRFSSIFINFIQRLFNLNETHTLVFYLDGTTNKLLERISVRNTYTDELDYIKMQRSTLLNIARGFSSVERFHYIDTSGMNIPEVQKTILMMVNNELRVKNY